jgi:hypothetical protein
MRGLVHRSMLAYTWHTLVSTSWWVVRNSRGGAGAWQGEVGIALLASLFHIQHVLCIRADVPSSHIQVKCIHVTVSMFTASHLRVGQIHLSSLHLDLHPYHTLLPSRQCMELTYGALQPDGSKQLLTFRDSSKHIDDLRLVRLSLRLIATALAHAQYPLTCRP